MNHQITLLSIPMPYGAPGDLIYPVLLQDGTDNILVDCGCVGSLADIEAALDRHGVSAAHITGIVLTHQDHDHMGAAAAFKEKYPAAQIYASSLEAPYISGAEPSLRLRQARALQETLPPEMQDFGRAFCTLLESVAPVSVDVPLQDGDTFGWCGGCRVVATPGHTPGHIALFLPEQRVVIAGDAIALEGGTPTIANPQFTLNVGEATASMDALLSLGADEVMCYHGGVLHPRQKERGT